MAADPLQERLQRAVSPDYRVERELGGGGWGRVYLAHEVLLNRDVAIKVLRPELATADAAESFVREAQMLASIRHPNVIVIHQAREGEGLQFYVMELVQGPTLEGRLASGAIGVNDAVRIGVDLLDGLETVHRLGVVHRDIKPSNVFVLPDRALLGDFGIARPPSEQDDAHARDGTPEYMAPEQVDGKSITPRTDIYSTGVVVYEAATGRRFHEQGTQVDWNGMPGDLARVLQRAVATQPEERWADAASFRKALEATQTPQVARRIAAVLGAGVLVVAAVVLIKNGGHRTPPPPPPRNNPGVPMVSFDRIDYVGPPNDHALADSLLRMVQSDLHDHLNFGNPAPLAIQARMTVSRDDMGLRLTGGIPASEFHVPLDRWPALRDSLSYQILLGVWRDRSPLASLPIRALPRTWEGLVRVLEAEQLVARAEWEDAYDAYLKAEASDATCWICSWRITEIERWLGRQPDPARVQRYRVHADSLPQPFRGIIRAAQLPLRARLDTLRAAADSTRENFLGWFQLGDELFHRGPLAGHRRSEAIPAFERAARLRPDFGPAWEHLAWAATAEGDSADAANALDSLERHSVAPDPYSRTLRALLQLGFAWRFTPESQAQRSTEQVVNEPAVQSSADLGAGPRLLPTFDVPRGAIALGIILQNSSQQDLRRSGLIAQTLAAVALGRLQDAGDLAGKLTEVAPEAELGLFTAELPGALALLDPGSISVADAVDGLQPWIASGNARAKWMLELLGQHQAGALPGPLELLVAADSLATAGRPRAALVLLDPVDVDAAALRLDPFYRTIVHLRRAAWRARIGDIEGARSDLLWYEHLDVVGLPTDLPQAAEVDWAFGTLARWRLARLLDAGRGKHRDACDAYAAVARHWSRAPVPYGARADTARTRMRQLDCAAAR